MYILGIIFGVMKTFKKRGLTQCRHFFFLSFFIPLFFFFLFIHFCLSTCVQVSSFIPSFFHFFFFLLASKSFPSFFTFLLVSKFYYKSMSTIFYHKFYAQSNSKKNSIKNFKKSLYWKFQEFFLIIFMQICISCVVKIQCPR